jgi:hypothetical protein
MDVSNNIKLTEMTDEQLRVKVATLLYPDRPPPICWHTQEVQQIIIIYALKLFLNIRRT